MLTDGVRQSETLQRPDFPQVCIVSTYKHIYCRSTVHIWTGRRPIYHIHNYLCIHTLIYAIMDIRMSVILFVESRCRSYHPRQRAARRVFHTRAVVAGREKRVAEIIVRVIHPKIMQVFKQLASVR